MYICIYMCADVDVHVYNMFSYVDLVVHADVEVHVYVYSYVLLYYSTSVWLHDIYTAKDRNFIIINKVFSINIVPIY